MAFQISYRQRGALAHDDNIFSLGPDWSCSLRSFVVASTNYLDEVAIGLHSGGAGLVRYVPGVPQFWKGDWMTMPDPFTCYADKPDGSRDVFGVSYTNSMGTRLLFLSQRLDPADNAITYNYTYADAGATIRLSSITDADGQTSTLYYTSGDSYSNRIDHITDPYGRSCYLQYDEYGYLTNVTDVQGLASSFTYGEHGISSMTTPYGSTTFECGGLALEYEAYLFTPYAGANRYVHITQPGGGHQLYVYRQDGSEVVTNSYLPVPTTSPLTNWFDNVDQSQANSEWRLIKGMLRWFLRLLPAAFDDHLVARFGEQAKVFGSSFHGARFGTLRALQQEVVGDGLIKKSPQFAAGAR